MTTRDAGSDMRERYCKGPTRASSFTPDAHNNRPSDLLHFVVTR